jgi:DNA-binding CsgD family transcriptional regulator
MVLTDNVRLLTLDGQYITMENIEIIRFALLDLFHKHSVICRLKSYPHLINPEDELNHIQLLDPVWLEFSELELIDLDGKQTLVRFYEPGLIELSEIKEHEQSIRQFLYRPGIELWLYENLGWTAKVIEILAEELYDHRLACLRNTQNLLMNKLGLIRYPLSYFQIQAGPQIGISQFQPVMYQPEGEIDRDIPIGHPVEEREISITSDNQELLRLWTAGLTAKEIGLRIGKTEKTILNRLTVLRRIYGEGRVHRRK